MAALCPVSHEMPGMPGHARFSAGAVSSHHELLQPLRHLHVQNARNREGRPEDLGRFAPVWRAFLPPGEKFPRSFPEQHHRCLREHAGTSQHRRGDAVSVAALLLSDSRFPAGGHAHSGGVEPAVTAGTVTDMASLEGFLRGRLRTAGLVAAGVAAAACAATRLPDANRWCARGGMRAPVRSP